MQFSDRNIDISDEEIGRQVKRLRRLCSMVVLGLLCAVSYVNAATASAATWTGTTNGKFEASTRQFSADTSWRGNFWFTTTRGGEVRGRAVVAYEPTADVSGLNSAIGYVQTIGIAGATAPLGPFGAAVAAAGIGQIVGVNVSFREVLAVREGPLTGRFRCTARERGGRCLAGKLKLIWHAKLDPIRSDISLQLVSASEGLSREDLPLHDPFEHVGDVSNGRHAVSVPKPGTVKDDGVLRLDGSYWAADRVG